MANSEGAVTHVGVEGVENYRKQLKQAQQQLKLLQAELKRDTTALGNNATAEQKNAVQAENLRKKITQQQQVVAAMKKALAEATAAYGEGSTAVVQWQTRLANAETQLNSMTNSLSSLQSGMEQTSTTVTDTAQQTANFSDGLSKLKDVASSAASGVTQVFSSTLSTVKSIVDEITGLMDTAMNTVEGWKGISNSYGGSDVDIQTMYYKYVRAGLGISDMKGDIDKLVQRTHAGSADSVLAQLGISENQYSSHWDFYQAVMEALMGGGYNQSQVEQMAEDLFGKNNSADMANLFTHWSSGTEVVSDLQQSGGILSQETVNTVDTFAEKLTEIKEKWAALQTAGGASLILSVGTDITDHVSNILDDVTAIFSPETTDEEKRQATLKLSADINLLATDLATVIENISSFFGETGDELAESSNPVVAAIGKLMQTAQSIMDKISENLPGILEKLEALWPYIEANMVTKAITGQSIPTLIGNVVSGLSDIVIAISLIKGGSFLGSGTGSVTGVAAGGTLAKSLGSTGAMALAGGTAFVYGLAGGLITGSSDAVDTIVGSSGKEYDDYASYQAAVDAGIETKDPFQSIIEGNIPEQLAIAGTNGLSDYSSALGGSISETLATLLPLISSDGTIGQNVGDALTNNMAKITEACKTGIANGMAGVTINLDGMKIAALISGYLVAN